MSEMTPSVDPSRTALLVMDYQVGILDSFKTDLEPLLSKVEDSVACVRRSGGTVGFVRLAFRDGDYAKTGPMATRISAAGRFFHDDEPSTSIHPRFAPRDGDVIVRKTRVGAFSTTELDDLLRREGIDTLVLTGVATSGVVLTTAREAYDRDYVVYVIADGCFDPDPSIHAALITQILPRQAQIITVGQLEALLADAG